MPLISSARVVAVVSVVVVVVTLSVRPVPGDIERPRTLLAATSLPVRVAPPAHGPVSRPIHAAGRTFARRSQDLAFAVGGQVLWVGVDAGARVKRGQVLARLDTAQLAAQAARARAASTKANRDLAQVRTLAQMGSSPANAVDDAATNASVATAQDEEAQFALQHGALLAPDDGEIDARHVERGQVVSAGQPVAHFTVRPALAAVRVDLGDREIVDLEPGAGARVWLDALPGQPLVGSVSSIACEPAPGSGAFEVQVEVDGAPPRGFRSGLAAKVDFERSVTPGALLPVGALAAGTRDEAYVFAVVGGHARRVPVHVLFFDGDRVAVEEPLAGVDAVVVQGSASLVDGDAVVVVP